MHLFRYLRKSFQSFHPTFYIKSISWLTLLVFILNTFVPSSLALPALNTVQPVAILEQLQIPEALGQVEDQFLPPKNLSGPMVIHIQDAHAQPEAQRNIQAILEHLHRRGILHTLALEGAMGKVNPQMLNLLADREVNRQMADQLINKGELTGAERFALDVPSVSIEGIENPELYGKSYTLFREIRSADKEIQNIFQQYQRALEDLQTRKLNKDLRDFVLKRENWHEKSDESSEYFQTLSRLSFKYLAFDLADARYQFEWPNLSRIIALQKQEQTVEPGRLAAELSRIQDEIKKARTEKNRDFLSQGLEKLDSDASGFNLWLREQGASLSIVTVRQFSEFLYRFADKTGIGLADFPQILNALGMQILREELDAAALFGELKRLENQLEIKMIQSQEEKKILMLGENLELVRKLFNLHFSREDQQNYLQKKESLTPDNLHKQFLQMLDKSKTGELRLFPAKLQKQAESFYEFSRRRDNSLLENALRLPSSNQVVVLISGGFHTEGFKSLLRDKQIPFAVIRPRMTQVASDHLYEKVMMGEASDLEKILALEENNLSAEILSQSAADFKKPGVYPDRQRIVLAGSLLTVGVRSLQAKGYSLEAIHNQLASTFARHADIFGDARIIRIDGTDENPGSLAVEIPSLGIKKSFQEGLSGLREIPANKVSNSSSPNFWSRFLQIAGTINPFQSAQLSREIAVSNSQVRSEVRVFGPDDAAKNLFRKLANANTERGRRIDAAIFAVNDLKEKELKKQEQLGGQRPSLRLVSRPDTFTGASRSVPLIEDLAREVYQSRHLYQLPLAYRAVFALAVFDSLNFQHVHKRIYEIITKVKLDEHAESDRLSASEFAKVIKEFARAEYQDTLEDNQMLRFALNELIFDFGPNERRALEKEALVNELQKELQKPGAGNIPQLVFLTDLHGSRKVGSLIGYALGLKNYQTIESVEDLEKRLKTENIDLEKKNILFIGGSDYVDRGPKPYWGFKFIRWLRQKGKLKFINGNHDLWKDWNLLGLHLRVHDTLREIVQSKRYEESDIPSQLEKISPFISELNLTPAQKKVLHQIMTSQMAEFLKRAKENQVTDKDIQIFADEIINAGSNPTHSLENWSDDWYNHAGWADTFLDQLNEELINEVIRQANEYVQNSPRLIARLIPLLSEAQRKKFEEKGILFEAIDASLFSKGDAIKAAKTEIQKIKDANAIIRQENEKLAAVGKFDEMKKQQKVVTTFPQTSQAARDYLENLYLEIDKLNQALPGLNLPKFPVELVTPENYRHNPIVMETALWNFKNFRLIYVDVYGNAYLHGILPVDEDRADFKVYYRGLHGIAAIERIQYDVRRFFERYQTIPDTAEFRAEVHRELGEAFNVLNEWYSDVLAYLKPANIKKFLDQGGPSHFRDAYATASALSERNFEGNKGVMHLGHVEAAKLKGANISYWFGAMNGGVLHGDFEMSEGYEGLGAVITHFMRGTDGLSGIRRFGYKVSRASVEKKIKKYKEEKKPEEEIKKLEILLDDIKREGDIVEDITIHKDLLSDQIDSVKPFISGKDLVHYYIERFLEENQETYGQLIEDAKLRGLDARAAFYEGKRRDTHDRLNVFLDKNGSSDSARSELRAKKNKDLPLAIGRVIEKIESSSLGEDLHRQTILDYLQKAQNKAKQGTPASEVAQDIYAAKNLFPTEGEMNVDSVNNARRAFGTLVALTKSLLPPPANASEQKSRGFFPRSEVRVSSSEDQRKKKEEYYARVDDELKIVSQVLSKFAPQDISGLSRFVRAEVLLTLLYGGRLQYDDYEVVNGEKKWNRFIYPSLIGLKNHQSNGINPKHLKSVETFIAMVTDRLNTRYNIRESFFEALALDPYYQQPFLHTYLGISRKKSLTFENKNFHYAESRLERAIDFGEFAPEVEAHMRQFNDIFEPEIITGVPHTSRKVKPYVIRAKHNNDKRLDSASIQNLLKAIHPERDPKIIARQVQGLNLSKVFAKGGIRFMFAYNFDDALFQERFQKLVQAGANLEELEFFKRKWVREETLPLSVGMTNKSAPELPHGGGKGSIDFTEVVKDKNGVVSIKDLGAGERFRWSVSRKYVESLFQAGRIGYDIDVPAPDMGSNSKDMDIMADEAVKLTILKMRKEKTFETLPAELATKFINVIWSIDGNPDKNISGEPDRGIFGTYFLSTLVQYLDGLRLENIPVPESVMPLVRSMATFTAKTVDNGGSEFRGDSTGYGGIYVLEEMLRKEGKPLLNNELTAKVMGFGGVGRPAVRALIAKGVRVTMIDEGPKGLVVKEKGFTLQDVETLGKLLSQEGNFTRLNEPGSDYLVEGTAFFPADSGDEKMEEHNRGLFFSTHTNILVLAALENSIREDNVGDVEADYIAELSNGGITNAAYYRLVQNGKVVAPDTLANAGGVTVSYFEWVQNLLNERWSKEQVRKAMEDSLSRAVEKAYEYKRQYEDWRTAVDVYAIHQVEEGRAEKNGEAKRSELRQTTVPDLLVSELKPQGRDFESFSWAIGSVSFNLIQPELASRFEDFFLGFFFPETSTLNKVPFSAQVMDSDKASSLPRTVALVRVDQSIPEVDLNALHLSAGSRVVVLDYEGQQPLAWDRYSQIKLPAGVRLETVRIKDRLPTLQELQKIFSKNTQSIPVLLFPSGFDGLLEGYKSAALRDGFVASLPRQGKAVAPFLSLLSRSVPATLLRDVPSELFTVKLHTDALSPAFVPAGQENRFTDWAQAALSARLVSQAA